MPLCTAGRTCPNCSFACRKTTGKGENAIRAARRQLGAFLAGSNTISNMMFSFFQISTMVVSLQAVGGADDKMVTVHNVVAASAIVGLLGREGDVIRKTLIPMAYYMAAAGLLGMAIITGGTNLWYAGWLGFLGIVLVFMMTNRGGR